MVEYLLIVLLVVVDWLGCCWREEASWKLHRHHPTWQPPCSHRHRGCFHLQQSRTRTTTCAPPCVYICTIIKLATCRTLSLPSLQYWIRCMCDLYGLLVTILDFLFSLITMLLLLSQYITDLQCGKICAFFVSQWTVK